MMEERRPGDGDGHGSLGGDEAGTAEESRGEQGAGGPSALRALCVFALLNLTILFLATRGETGVDNFVRTAGRIEVTARLVERPDHFPELGAYKYTYVLPYIVLAIHRQDPQGKYHLRPGDEIFVGHYKPWQPRSQIKDADWGETPLGGRLTRFVAGEAHRMALDYELENLAPAGVLDYCYPFGINRFFAVWVNTAGSIGK